MENKVCIHTIENGEIRVSISTLGAEVCGIYGKDNGIAYLKRPGGPFWSGSSPILFPINGRLWEGKTEVDGKTYEMGTHGFARRMVFEVEEKTDDHIVLTLRDTAETYEKAYPYHFLLKVTYSVVGSTLNTKLSVKNTDKKPLPFTVGFHPGFRVPLTENETFEDYYLEFRTPCDPQCWVLSERYFLTHETKPYPLENRQTLLLRHDLFDNDAVFLENVSDTVTLRSKTSPHAVEVSYKGFPTVGFWHTPMAEADFVCIEPWCGQPDYDSEPTALPDKERMFTIAPNTEKSFSYDITVR